MFNFYEFPVQLHFTCRDKRKRGKKIFERGPASPSPGAGWRQRGAGNGSATH